MEYLITFDNGSCAVLEHSGVKGMKWGVWNAETRARRAGARQHKKNLRALDSQLKVATMMGSNTKNVADMHRKTAEKLRIKGKLEKASKHDALAKAYDVKFNSLSSARTKAAKQLVQELMQTNKEGYSVKVSPTDFTSGRGRDFRKLEKDSRAASGKRYRLGPSPSNASSGNRFQVKPSEKLSPEKQQLWKRSQKDLQSYRPQRVEVHYY